MRAGSRVLVMARKGGVDGGHGVGGGWRFGERNGGVRQMVGAWVG